MSIIKMTSSLAFGVSLIALTSTSTLAQDIDYGSLEDMFGEAVTTSATGKPQRINDAPVTMDIITADDIRRAGSNDLGGILRRLSGIDTSQMTAGQTEVAIRGYNQGYSPRLLVLVNGRQVYINFFGFVAWDQIPVQLEEIRQIEVVKGPNTALFGFNAVSGVINIVTYNPAYDTKGAASITAGSGNYIEGRGFVSGTLSEKLGVRVSAGYKELDPFTKNVVNTSILNGYGKHSSAKGNVELMYMPNDNSKLAFEFTGSDGPYDSLYPIWTYGVSELDTYSLRVYGSYNASFGLVKGQIFQNNTSFSGKGLDGLLTVGMDDKLTTAKLETLVGVSPKSTLRFAGEYRKSDTHLLAVVATPNSGSDVSTEVFSLSGLWDYAATDKLSTAVSIRYDHQGVERQGFIPSTFSFTNEDYSSLSYSELTYNLGAVYKISDMDTVRIMVSRGILPPNAVDLGLFAEEPGFGNVALASAPGFKATSVQHFEVGYDRSLSGINGMFRLAAYYQKSSDVKALWNSVFGMEAGVMGPVSMARSIGDSDVYGFELGLSGEASENIKWGLNYSYSKVKDDFSNRSPSGLLINAMQYEEFDPNHHANAWLSYTRGKFELDLQAHYVGERSAPEDFLFGQPFVEVKIKDDIILDARIAYHVSENFEVELKGTNLTMKTQYLHVQPVERRIYAGMRYSF